MATLKNSKWYSTLLNTTFKNNNWGSTLLNTPQLSLRPDCCFKGTVQQTREGENNLPEKCIRNNTKTFLPGWKLLIILFFLCYFFISFSSNKKGVTEELEKVVTRLEEARNEAMDMRESGGLGGHIRNRQRPEL